MRKVCTTVLLLCGFGSANLLSPCGDKFLSVGRGTRLQQAPRGRQESIIIYANSASDVPAALARVSVESTLRGAGYRPKTVSEPAEFEKALTQAKWDLVLVGLADAEAVSKRNEKVGILPVALKPSADLKRAQKQYPVILTKPATSDSLVRVIYESLSSWSRILKNAKTG
jgi:hypothetical protein